MQLRPFQKEAIQLLENNIHLVCVAPTGSGKSTIFERTIYQFRHRTLIVSPLLALARQQKEKIFGEDVIVCSPEWLEVNFSSVQKWGPEFLVVDECHCIEEWGRDFRPAFRKLPQLPSKLKISKSLWLTATLHPKMKRILHNELPQPQIWLGETSVPKNLELLVINSPWNQRLMMLKRIVETHFEAGIIFVSSRAAAERLQNFLSGFQISTCYYHAGLSQEERKNVEDLVSNQKIRVIICTSAFGMGMDFPWLRWVILFDLPYSLLALIQSVGRVTRREHEKSRAYFFWDSIDFTSGKIHSHELRNLKDFYHEEVCRTRYLESYFDEKVSTARCNRCDLCYSRNL